jgi:Domain of unknown function (DUF3497).
VDSATIKSIPKASLEDYFINILIFSQVHTASRLLSEEEKAHWSRITTLTPLNDSPSTLVHTFNQYLISLTTSQQDTYTDPFEVVAPNMALGVDIVDARSLFGFESDGSIREGVDTYLTIEKVSPFLYGMLSVSVKELAS